MVKGRKSDSASFEDLLRPLPEPVRQTVARLRKIILDALPDCDEAISAGKKIGMALYSIDGRNNVVCGIQPTGSHCKLFFHGWEQLAKAGHRLEGSGKHARHVKFKAPAEIDPETLAGMIRIARSSRNL